MFTQIHKGIRAMMYTLAMQVQSTDFTDTTAREDILARLEHDLDMMEEHAAHEDERIFPAIARHEPGVLQVLDAEHVEIYRCSETIRTAMRDARATDDPASLVRAGATLTRACNELIAMQSLHMNHEEATASPALWRHYSDEQLVEMRQRIIAHQTPERYAEWAGWMLPACNDQELLGILRGIAATAPPPARERYFTLASSVLGQDRWSRIEARIGS